MTDDNTDDKPKPRSVKEMRRRLATKRKAFAEPAPIRKALQRASDATREHLNAGTRPAGHRGRRGGSR